MTCTLGQEIRENLDIVFNRTHFMSVLSEFIHMEPLSCQKINLFEELKILPKKILLFDQKEKDECVQRIEEKIKQEIRSVRGDTNELAQAIDFAIHFSKEVSRVPPG